MISPICPIRRKTHKLWILINTLATPKKIIKQITKITNRFFNKRPNNKKNIKTKHEYDLIMEKCGCNYKLNFEIN